MLFRAAQGPLTKYVLSLGVREHDVDDLVSITGVALWERRERFSGSYDDFVAFGICIARHRVSQWRTQSRRQRRDRDLPSEALEHFAGPEDLDDGGSPEAIADEIGLSVARVWGIYHEALTRLQRDE